MTKAEEIAVLLDAAAKLDSNTYLGPWLRESIPFLLDTIRSDIAPLSADSAHRQYKAIVDEAMAKAQQIEEDAIAKAKRIVATAENEANRIRSRLYDTVNTCLKEITQ
jgi:cell division septum initiation protein DivIVA